MNHAAEEFYGTVPAEEIAFAMSIFVSAANMRLPPVPGHDKSPMSGPGEQSFLKRSIQTYGWDYIQEATRDGEASLDQAFGVLWRLYKGDCRQEPICARVLAFHFLMIRTRGALVEDWTRVSDDDEGCIFLDPAVIDAVASVPLPIGRPLPPATFLAAVEHAAAVCC